MNSFATFIDAVGAPSLAKLTGVEQSHVRVWRARDSIPPEYWNTILRKLPKPMRGEVSHERFCEMRVRRFREKKRGASQ